MGDKIQNLTTDNTTHNVDVSTAKKGRWGRCLLHALLVLFALVILSICAVLTWLDPIVERYVERHDMEYVGRRVEMDNLNLMLLRGRVEVDNLRIYEDDATTEFVRIGHLMTVIDLRAISDEHIHVKTVRLVEPYFGIMQQGDTFNFDSLVEYLMEEYSDDDDEQDDNDDAWRVTIDDVVIKEGTLGYYDEALDQHWDLTALNLSTPAILLDDAISTIALETNINEVARLDGTMELNCQSLDFSFDGILQDFSLGDVYKYIKPSVNLADLQGVVAMDVDIDGCLTDIMAMNIAGDIGVDNLAIAGPDGGNLLSATRLDLSIEELNVDAERYIFNRVAANGFATQLHFREDGTTNFNMLFYGEPEVSVEATATAVGDEMYAVQERVTVTTSEEVAPFSNTTLRIASLDLQGGEWQYSDKTMHEDFHYVLRNTSITSDNFDIKEKNKMTIRTKLPKQGSALLLWEGSLTDFYNQSLLVMLTNVDMKGLSTYLEHFTAYPITSGNMTIRSQNVVTNGKLSGVNQLGTYKFAIGDKNKELDAEYKLPLKLGIFVLTDRDDHIDVDFPITGNIESPEFSYRKIIWKAIGNMILKIVATPFEWMIGEKQDAFRHIDLDLLSPGLDSEHYARLDKMAEMLKEDPSLSVRLTQRVNYDRAVQRLADLNLKIAYYNATQGNENGYLDMLDFVRIKDMRLSGKGVVAFADSMLVSRGIDPQMMTLHAKAKTIYGDMAGGQLQELMNHRNRIIAEYIAFQHNDMADGAFVINDVVIEDMKNYNGKDRYTVTLVIDDEEVEMASSTVDETLDEDYYDAYILEDEPLGTEVAEEDNLALDETLDEVESAQLATEVVATE